MAHYFPAEVDQEPDTRTEAQKRAAVFLKAPETILVKVLAMGTIPGVPRSAENKGEANKDRDDTGIELRHIAEAEDRGLNPFAYRERADTGFCLFEKEEGVYINSLLGQMWDAGYLLADFRWQQQNNKGPVTTFEFVQCKNGQKPSDGKRLPPEALRILTAMRFNNCTVWCNLKNRQEGTGQFRLDTINLAKGRTTQEPSRQLEMDGRTYRLV